MNAHEKTSPSKGESTRKDILEAAISFFSARGYEGASIRDIEQRAGVNRGLVTYHFRNKEELWKATFDYAFRPYFDDQRSKLRMIRGLDSETRLKLVIGNLIRASAERPYMNQLMMQENFEPSWRFDWIVDQFLKPTAKMESDLGNHDPWVHVIMTNPHVRYMLVGACTTPFSLSAEVSALFGKNAFSETFINDHIEMVTRTLLPLLRELGQRKS
ncbi:TetR/AcrR family transcriptional regulator [Tropicibacter sp. Alg240-R139]|uniref:TetR/AcrR family transcriptional regulator n=1 Tax=Tropicibacter sp. Alg240-R139 TaxID=2305991 RepID=UPI0013DFD1F5|nr:TetR family transcriptional regulator [Tropicibacter sp. Alg240-R139]